MKKIVICLILFIVILLENNIFAISDDFKFVIDTIGIPQYNVYNDEINEQIYYTYNIFVYSDPISMYLKTNTQRFKDVPNYGKWTKEGAAYSGSGTRGEYYVLGTSYSGKIIENVYFPVDSVPETTPNNWNFIAIDNAYSSWNDTNNYKYIEQLEYMKNTQLLFDDIDLKNNTSNSYNLIEYGITPTSIGLDKARLNTCSTWKTMGIVSSRRINNKGETRNAIFATRPMAASANIVSKIKVENDITLENEDDSIKINFGANVVNLNDYAVPKHIKEITSILYINGKEYSRVSGSKTVDLDKEINFTVPKEIYDIPQNHTLNLKVLSYLYTEFSVDGLIKNTIEKNITIKIPDKPVVPINYIDIKILKKENNTLVVSPLVQTLITNSMNSRGMVEAGRNLAIKINSNIAINEQDNIEFYINNNMINPELLMKEDNNYIYKVKLDEKLENTLCSWNYLRNVTGDYFKVNFNDIGKRIEDPNVIRVKITYEQSIYETYITFDSIDEFLINVGYEFSNDVININEINKEEKINEWIKEM